jgi:hypothetical protein
MMFFSTAYFILSTLLFLIHAGSYGAALNGEITEKHLWNSSWAGKRIDCTKTHWMHTAKTGSTFCLAIQHVCCKENFELLTEGIHSQTLTYAFGSSRNRTLAPFHYDAQYCFKFVRDGYPPLQCTFAGRPEHIPLYRSTDLSAEMGMVMIREPKARVISALLDGVHLEGFVNRTRGYELRNIFTAMDKDTTTPHTHQLMQKADLYCFHPMLYGHQTKMLLGEMDLDLSIQKPDLYPSVVERAVEVLRRFYFVGIFEEYKRSLKLFHALADAGMAPILRA